MSVARVSGTGTKEGGRFAEPRRQGGPKAREMRMKLPKEPEPVELGRRNNRRGSGEEKRRDLARGEEVAALEGEHEGKTQKNAVESGPGTGHATEQPSGLCGCPR